jgi:hypothetical protein
MAISRFEPPAATVVPRFGAFPLKKCFPQILEQNIVLAIALDYKIWCDHLNFIPQVRGQFEASCKATVRRLQMPRQEKLIWIPIS